MKFKRLAISHSNWKTPSIVYRHSRHRWTMGTAEMSYWYSMKELLIFVDDNEMVNRDVSLIRPAKLSLKNSYQIAIQNPTNCAMKRNIHRENLQLYDFRIIFHLYLSVEWVSQ